MNVQQYFETQKGKSMKDEVTEVVVIGGGLSGLVAARQLILNGVDNVVVLEAREEIGGKCLLRDVGGIHVDVGGMFVGPGQEHLVGLADELGISRYASGGETGQMVRWFGVEPEYKDAADPVLDRARQDVVDEALARFAATCRDVPGDKPWEASHATQLDSMTLEQWILDQSDDAEIQVAIARRFKTAAASPSQISLLAFASFVSSCGGWEVFEQELEELFDGGAGQLPLRIAAELGARVRPNWPVSTIDWSAEEVRITGPRGVVRAKRVIIAMSPADARRIQFTPGLTNARELLHRSWFSASIIKSMVLYERPFWREANGSRPALTGYGHNDGGCPHVVIDVSPRDASVGILGAMTRLQGEGERFSPGQRVLDDPSAHRELLLASLSEMFGPEAADPIAVRDTRWFHEAHISGCLGWAPPGGLTKFGSALKEPIGPIHWAGAETADVWQNHLSGAVQAGERAAEAVIGSLLPAQEISFSHA